MSDNKENTEATSALAQAQAKFEGQQQQTTLSNSDVVTPKNTPNPANSSETFDEDNWVPMSAPRARLYVPEKPGWHRHWFRNEPGRIEKAMRAGYRFVAADDVSVVGNLIGGSPEEGNNTDLGTRISLAAGGYGDNGQALRLYLMECPQHLFERSKDLLQQNTDRTVAALSAGRGGSDDQYSEDGKTYIRGDLPPLFRKKRQG